jgi:Dynamin family
MGLYGEQLWSSLLEWKQELEASTVLHDEAVAERLRAVAHQVDATEVVLTFGGHFSSGKSTVINAVLGRLLLPVDDYPETGAMCVLRAGYQDKAEVLTSNGPRTIPCTTEAIREEVALVAATGESNHRASRVKRLEIRLQGGVVPPQVSYRDSPGTNDTGAMNDRAWKAAESSDVLCWVLSSRQPLSEVEVEFLAEHLRDHGSAAVVFVLNVFLADDTVAEWKRALKTTVPFCRNKLRTRGPEMGLGRDHPELVVVAGRAAGGQASGHFGGPALRRLTRSLATPQHWRVLASRLHRAAMELEKLTAEMEDQSRQQEARHDAEQAAWQARERERAQQRRRFERLARDQVNTALVTFSQLASAHEEELVASITPASLVRGDHYGASLTATLQRHAGTSAARLADALSEQAAHHGQRRLAHDAREELRRTLEPPKVTVEVPATPTQGHAGVGATVGGIIGFILGAGPPGAAIGAMIGGAGGAAFQNSGKAQAEDVAGTQANVRAAVRQAVTSVQGRRERALGCIMRHCMQPGTAPSPPSAVPSREERALTSLRRLVGRARELSRLAAAAGEIEERSHDQMGDAHDEQHRTTVAAGSGGAGHPSG